MIHVFLSKKYMNDEERSRVLLCVGVGQSCLRLDRFALSLLLHFLHQVKKWKSYLRKIICGCKDMGF